MAKILLVTGLIVAYGYMIEAFMAWYSANTYEIYMMRNRMTGPYGPFYWALIFCNVLTPQLLWIKKIRTNVVLLFIISLIVNVGMWLERFVIVVTSLHRDFLPSSWGRYSPTMWDWGTVCRHDRPVPVAAVPLPALPPDDFDLRDAHARAGQRPVRLKPDTTGNPTPGNAGRPPSGGPGRHAMKPSGRPTIYGLMAEFETSHALVEAARRAHHEGYRKMDAYSPVPIEELHDALHMHDNRLPKLVLAGGILGGLGGYGLQYYVAAIAYPLNVGGRPLHSWPMFIPVTFETTILAAALSAVLGMLALNGLPQPFHPVFNVPRFALASRNRFFLCIESRDPKFNVERTRTFLESLGAREVTTVED